MTDIVQEMLKRGVLLTPEAADELRKRPELVASLSSSATIVDISDLQVRPVVTRAPARKQHNVRILKEHAPTKGNAQIGALVDAYTNRHMFYRSLLEPKADRSLIVSISNTKTRGSRVSVIGIVRDVHQGSATIEDSTGSVNVMTNERLIEDEGVLVTGPFVSDGVVAETIQFPDIPMGRQVKTAAEPTAGVFAHSVPENPENSVSVVTDAAAKKILVEKLSESNTVVWPNGSSTKIICPKTPCTLNIEGLVVLVHSVSATEMQKTTGIDDPEKAAVRLLRSRHLGPNRFVTGDPLLLKEVPDIICLCTGVPFATNYKGVTIVSPTKEKAYSINLQTREIVPT